MNKNAYHYLFGQDTLYQTADSEPIVRKPAKPVESIVQPEPVAEVPVVEQAISEREAPVVEQAVTNQMVETIEPQQPISAPEPEPAPALVAVTEPAADATPLPILEAPIQHAAGEKPKVLLLIDEELTPGELIFLENILKAINLNLNEVDMLNLAGSGLVDFHAVLENKTLHHFISFGVPFRTIHLNIQMDRYQPIRIFGITFLLADPLSAIEADQKLKRKLWAVLKQAFLD